MVHKRYVRKNGKVYGPYLYENKRVNGKVVTRYVGKDFELNLPEKNLRNNIFSLSFNKYLLISLFVLLLLIGLLFFAPRFTGNITAKLDSSYEVGQPIDGTVTLHLRQGELLPRDSILLLVHGNQTKEISLSELSFKQSSVSGSFYAEQAELSGSGEGFGFAGKKTLNPIIKFKLSIYEEESKPEEVKSDSIEKTSGIDEIDKDKQEDINKEKEIKEPKVEKEEEKSQDKEFNKEKEIKEPKVEKEEEKSQDKELKGGSELAAAEVSKNAPLTGGAVSETYLVVEGSVSAGEPFSYVLRPEETANLISGSVQANGNILSDDILDIALDKNGVKVSTKYSVSEEGFGSEFLGDESLDLEINLSQFGLIAENEKLILKLIYGNATISYIEKSISLEEERVKPESNKSTNTSTAIKIPESNLSLVKEIPSINIFPLGNYSINLSEYFKGAEFYSTEDLSSIRVNIDGEILILQSETDFAVLEELEILAHSGENFIRSNKFNIAVSSSEFSVTTLRDKIRVGKPVRWVKNVSLATIETFVVSLPVGAENITIKKDELGISKTASAEILNSSSQPIFGSSLITGQVTANIELNQPKKESIFKRIFYGITGRAVSEEASLIQEKNPGLTDSYDVVLNDSAISYTIEYYTEGPIMYEENSSTGKILTVFAPDELKYQDVIASTPIIPELFITDPKKIRLYLRNDNLSSGFIAHKIADEVPDSSVVDEVLNERNESDALEILSKEEKLLNESLGSQSSITGSAIEELEQENGLDTENTTQEKITVYANDSSIIIREGYALQAAPFNAYDFDGDGFIDNIEWVVPHLSNQTYEIIVITNAEHLDENKTFIEDIYEQVKARDGNWTGELPAEHYIRVVFEKNLTSQNDITVYAKSNYSNASIEVYEKNGNEKLADFEAIQEDRKYQIFLNNLSERTQDTFDLKIIGNPILCDYIVDPTILAGDTSYASNDSNITQQTGFAHLNITTTPPYDSLVLYYSFDGERTNSTVYDLSNSSLDATFFGNSQLLNDTSGCVYGGCANFSGGKTNITLDSTSQILNLTNKTVMFWVYKEHIVDTRIVLSDTVTTSYIGLGVSNQTGIGYTNSTGGAQSFTTSTGSTTTKGWFHMAVVFYVRNQSNVNFVQFINGTQIANRSDAFGITTYPLKYIGIRSNQGLIFNGSIDELMIFNKELNSSDVLLIYRNQSSRFAVNGTQEFRYLNFTTNDTVNISVNFVQNMFASNLSAQINNGTLVNFTINSTNSGDIYIYNMTGNLTAANLTIYYFAGNQSVPFYTPIMRGNITLSSWLAAAAGDTLNPNVSLQSPANNSAENRGVVYFYANISDDTGLNNATLWVWNASSSLIGTNGTNFKGISNSTNLTLALPTNGTFFWNYLVYDTTNNSAFNASNLSVHLTSWPVAACTNLTSNNSVYIQTGNIVPVGSTFASCINISDVSNVTFDGNGYSIWNSTLNESAVGLVKVVNVSVKNTNLTMSNVSGGYGIELRQANASLIYNNTFTFNYYGLELFFSQNLNITKNTFYNTTLAAIFVENTAPKTFNATIEGNNFTRIGGRSIDAAGGDRIAIINNSFSYNLRASSANGEAINLGIGAENISIINNTCWFVGSDECIDLSGNNYTIIGNIIHNSSAGILFNNGGNSSLVMGNTITNMSQSGISISGAVNSNVTNNTISFNSYNGGYALELTSSGRNNTIYGNLYLYNIRQSIFLENTSNNTIFNEMINSSQRDTIFVHPGARDNNLTNITIYNTSVSYRDVEATLAGANWTYLIDMPHVSNYSFGGTGSIVYFKDSRFGEVRFFANVSGSGTNLSDDIQFRNNSVFVNGSRGGLNVSANVTLYGIATNFSIPSILINSTSACNVTTSPFTCSNFTALTAGIVRFNVSAWGGNYSVGEEIDITVPVVNLAAPTNNSYSSAATHSFNATFSDNRAVANSTLYVWNSSGPVINNTEVRNLGGAANSSNVSITLPYDGRFYWNYLVRDSSSNYAFNNSNYTILYDSTNPSIAYGTGTENNGANVSRNWTYVNVSVTETNFANITFILRNDTATVNTSTYTSLILTINWTNLADANYTYNVSIRDSANNFNSTENRLIRLDNLYPIVNITSPLNNTNFSTNNVTINYTIVESQIGNCWWTNDTGITNQSLTCGVNISRLWSEGITNATIYANDSSGNVNLTSVRFRVDTIQPNLTFASPTASNGSYITRNTVDINVSADDSGAGLANITIFLYNRSGFLNQSNTSTASAFFINYTNLNDNVYFYNASAADFVNNINITLTRTITIDTTNPSLSYAAPTENTAVFRNRNYIEINLTASDTNLVNISVYLYNASGFLNQSNTSTSSPFYINYSGLNEGVYIYNATATDSANNINNSATRNITLDRTNPSAQFVTNTESNNTYNVNGIINVNVTASDNSLTNITIRLHNSSGGVLRENVSTFSPFNISYNGLTNGTYYFNATTADLANNLNNSETRTITIDSTNPLISYGTGTENNGINVSRNWTYTNVSVTETNFANITFVLRNDTATVNTSTYTTLVLIINWTNLPDANYTYNVSIRDSANNFNSTENRLIRLDTTPPVVTINSPASTLSASSAVFNVTINEDGGSALFSLDGGVVNVSMQKNGNRDFNYTNTSIADGSYTVNFYVNDSLGNLNITASKAFSVSTSSGAAPAAVGGGGGGGGGASPSLKEILVPVEFSLNLEGVIFFEFERVQHRVRVSNIGSNYAEVVVIGKGDKAKLEIGDKKEFDVTGDGKYDVSLTLVSINSEKNEARFSIAPLEKILLEIEPEEISVNALLGVEVVKELQIINKGRKNISLSLREENLQGAVKFDKTLDIKSGQTKKLLLHINATNKTLLAGKLIFEYNGNLVKEIFIVINVKSENFLFDSLVSIPNKYRKVFSNEIIPVQIDLAQVGSKEKVDVTVYYQIRDFSGNKHFEEKETFFVLATKSYVKEFSLGNLPPGKYLVDVEVEYPGAFATSSAQFEIVEKSRFFNSASIIIFFLSTILIIIISLAFMAIKKRREHNKAIYRLMKSIKNKYKKN